MTTIAVRCGIMAADSCETFESEDAAYGTHQNTCQKMLRVGKLVIGLQGESTPGMVWWNWFRSAHQNVLDSGILHGMPRSIVDRFIEAEVEFTAVVLAPNGLVFEYDKWGIPVPVTAEFYAVGSGAKAALGAMHAGASAEMAILAACQVDPYTRGPVHVSGQES